MTGAQPDIFAGPRNDCWRTPKSLREAMAHQYDFAVDLAASKENAITPNFYSEEVSFLTHGLPWHGVAWMNPPFSQAEAFFGQVAKLMRLRNTLQLVSVYKPNFETACWQQHILPHATWVHALDKRVAYEPPDETVKVSQPQFTSVLIGFNVPPPRVTGGYTLHVGRWVEGPPAPVRTPKKKETKK